MASAARPIAPKSSGVRTIPSPKWCFQSRLTSTRAVSGLRRVDHPPGQLEPAAARGRARAGRAPPMTSRNRRGTTSPRVFGAAPDVDLLVLAGPVGDRQGQGRRRGSAASIVAVAGQAVVPELPLAGLGSRPRSATSRAIGRTGGARAVGEPDLVDGDEAVAVGM